MAKIESGESVIIVLHSPREKIVGVLDEINHSGVFLRGIDLNYFDEWTNAIKNGESFLMMQDYFFPMWRVERVFRDEDSLEMPSFTVLFKQRTGLEFAGF